MPPKENLERACEECIHYWACSRQCGEPMAQSSATGCECYETIKSSMAYYVGTLDGAKGKIQNRLRELAEADKDGRVVVLPCKVGDTVWIVGAVRKLYSAKVRTFFCGHPSAVRGRDPDGHIHMIRTTECDIPMQEFGKTVFLSREEAEKTLREIQGKEDADGATDKPE